MRIFLPFLFLWTHLIAYELEVVLADKEDCIKTHQISFQEALAPSTFKDEIELAFGIPAKEQILFFEEQQLGEEDLLPHYNIKKIYVARMKKKKSRSLVEVFRSYEEPILESEKEDLVFIVTSLADKSLAALFKMKSELTKAGERIDHLHPFIFLEQIFTDEKLKVAIRNIKKRGSWVWKEFIDGISSSLDDESTKGNLTEEYFLSFSSRLQIKKELIENAYKGKKWHDFVGLLIQHIPRQGDHNRYDI